LRFGCFWQSSQLWTVTNNKFLKLRKWYFIPFYCHPSFHDLQTNGSSLSFRKDNDASSLHRLAIYAVLNEEFEEPPNSWIEEIPHTW
jgi:hypothetical protein